MLVKMLCQLQSTQMSGIIEKVFLSKELKQIGWHYWIRVNFGALCRRMSLSLWDACWSVKEWNVKMCKHLNGSAKPKIVQFSELAIHSWPLNNSEVRGTNPRCSWKSTYNLWFPQNLTTNSLLLTGSLTDNINSWLTHIFYIICILYCVLKIK